MMNKTTRRLVAGLGATAMVGALVVSRVSLEAATASANLPVTASVAANCDIDVPGTLAFGPYDPIVANAATDLDADTTIDVRCTKNSPNVWVGLDTGANAAGAQRRLTDGGTEFMNYDLYQDAGRTTAWENTQATGVSYVPANSAWSSLTVYGRVPQAQDVGVGAYTDTVVATINF